MITMTPLMDIVDKINANPELKKIQDDGYEFIKQDRIAKIQAINEQYDLENNAYIAFSGGKDSTVLHYLIDMALPNNKIPRVFSNTGMEYIEIVKFVKEMQKNDDRIIILNNNLNIKKTLNKEGYPFKSKEISQAISIYFNNQDNCNYIINEFKNKELEEINKIYKNYSKIKGVDTALRSLNLGFYQKENKVLERKRGKINSKIKYLFSDKINDLQFKISDKCCLRFKENPMKKWSLSCKKQIAILGLTGGEEGRRNNAQCTVFNKIGNLTSFSPLSVINDIWEDEFIKRNNIEICKLYYPPYNFERTGCKGCPYNKDIQEYLSILYKQSPNEYKQCLHLWKPVYDEYIRIGYRLFYYPHEKGVQMSLDDYLEGEKNEK